MDASDCILSGSAALYLLHPVFIPNDLDFYVPLDTAVDFEYALHQRGYNPIHVDREHHESYYTSDAIATVARLQKPGVRRTINLITTRSNNPFTAVAQFHSTLVMNAITSDAVLCFYPLLTLGGRGIINVDTSKTRSCFKKYEDRGFEFTTTDSPWAQFADHICSTSAYCMKTVRSIDDSHVLSIPFHANSPPISKFAPFSWSLCEA
ncbi:hypothetical protein CVT26_002792 [Gymnopilus dilepis]|uniref:Uncharacterized protein n=1 Tax=Gymnopilus dilepis TaxID=231916 RepID=A0A409Y3E8_9AGAR|nr:hypothetical protein CVT26_002792 [Gymnopilus dilepis]